MREYELCLAIPAYFGNDVIESKVSGHPNYDSFLESLSNYQSVSRFISRSAEGRKIKSSDFDLALDLYSYLEVSIHYSDFSPEWVYEEYKKGNFSTILFSACTKKSCLQPRIIEAIEYEAAWRVSRRIRQQFYHIMEISEVTETIRQNHNAELVDEQVCPVVPNTRFSIEEEPSNFVLSLLLQTEEISPEFSQLDEHWKLPIAATSFWHQSSRIPNSFVVALLLNFLTCSGHLPRKNFGHPIIDSLTKKNDYLRALHAFAQWQCVYSDVIALNYVAREPLSVTRPDSLYSGEIAMGYAMEGNDIEEPNNNELYDKLKFLVM